MEALLGQLPDDESSTVPVITVKPENGPSSPASGGNKVAHTKPTYDPAVVYVLELCTVLALRTPETIQLLGKHVAEALQTILRNSGRYHSALVSRAAYYQFNMLKASYVSRLESPPLPPGLVANQPGSRLRSRSRIITYDLQLPPRYGSENISAGFARSKSLH